MVVMSDMKVSGDPLGDNLSPDPAAKTFFQRHTDHIKLLLFIKILHLIFGHNRVLVSLGIQAILTQISIVVFYLVSEFVFNVETNDVAWH